MQGEAVGQGVEGIPTVDVSLQELRRRRQELSDDCDAARENGKLDAYVRLLPQLALVENALEKAERKYIRLSREGPNHPAWQVRRQQLEDQFLQFYGHRGPQYEMLVRQAIAAQVRFEQAEASGRDIDIEEFRKIFRTAQEGMIALQRYTESTKIDHTEGRNQGIEVVLAVVEEILGTTQPELYALIVDTLVERARGGRGVLSAAPEAPREPVS